MKDNHSSANQDDCRCPCPIETSLNLIGGKYKALILWKLMNRTLRFSELRKQVPKATPKMLTQQLRELEQDGLVLRQVYAVVPPKVEYSLTTKGKSLEPILQALCSWGKTCLNNAAESSD
ncbi:helix-turn-helix domain-containing protein [Parasutterella muris]|uniref:Transcriptional regulator n=2 Tax=Parasutterella TaxID=577310 RepID=A0A6L6YHT5_9BURK|nr:helix-turn-helix domain-containing protein [Parasutterella muris]MVX56228.1 transcriptional regulator [Parasutterella muris]